jgi:hypothetical protein
MQPSTNLKPGQEVNVTVYFNDSRWNSARDANISLEIDGKPWTDCIIHNKKWNETMHWPMGDGTKTVIYMYKEVKIISYTGYARIEAICRLPTWLSTGTHMLKATPTMYSQPVYLMPATARFTVYQPSQPNPFLEFLMRVLLLKP